MYALTCTSRSKVSSYETTFGHFHFFRSSTLMTSTMKGWKFSMFASNSLLRRGVRVSQNRNSWLTSREILIVLPRSALPPNTTLGCSLWLASTPSTTVGWCRWSTSAPSTTLGYFLWSTSTPSINLGFTNNSWLSSLINSCLLGYLSTYLSFVHFFQLQCCLMSSSSLLKIN